MSVGGAQGDHANIYNDEQTFKSSYSKPVPEMVEYQIPETIYEVSSFHQRLQLTYRQQCMEAFLSSDEFDALWQEAYDRHFSILSYQRLIAVVQGIPWDRAKRSPYLTLRPTGNCTADPRGVA